MSILDAHAAATHRRERTPTADDLVRYRNVAYWKFITGALFFSACSLLPSFL